MSIASCTTPSLSNPPVKAPTKSQMALDVKLPLDPFGLLGRRSSTDREKRRYAAVGAALRTVVERPSHAIVADGFVFISGQIPVRPGGDPPRSAATRCRSRHAALSIILTQFVARVSRWWRKGSR